MRVWKRGDARSWRRSVLFVGAEGGGESTVKKGVSASAWCSPRCTIGFGDEFSVLRL